MRTRVAALAAFALLVATMGAMATAAPVLAGSLPSTLLTINSVEGKFYQYNEPPYLAPDPGAFDARNLKLPAFATETYPNIDFNPGAGTAIVAGCNNVPPGFQYEQAIPFTNVSPNGDGSCAFTEVPGAGDTHESFEATFVGSVTAPARGIYSLQVISDDGFVLGMGTRVGGTEKATAVAGPRVNAPGKTAVSKLPVMAAANQAQSPTAYRVLVFFPAAGDYPLEADYVQAAAGQMTFTVIPDEVNAPTVSVADANSVWDGDSGSGRSLKVQITLSRPVDMPVSVDYTIGDGNAVNGDPGDYKIKKTSGTVVFKPGVSSGLSPVIKTISIPVVTPNVTTGDPYFELRLSNPQGGVVIDNDLGLPTIYGDDLTSGPRIGVAPLTFIYSGIGKTRNVTVPITLSEPQLTDVTVHVATEDDAAEAGKEYKAVSKTVTIKAGKTQANLSIPIYVYDGQAGGNFFIRLSSPSGGLGLSDAGFDPGVGQVIICACSS